MTRYTQLALMLCVAVAGTAVEARADCHKVRGSIAETSIPSNDPFGRLLGTVTGVLNGASTVFLTSPPPNVTSYDVFLTTAGDVLIATGVSHPHARARRAGRVHLARGPDGRRRVWQVRRGDRHDDVRRQESHGHGAEDCQSRLPGNRVWAECQRRRELSLLLRHSSR